MRAALYARYSSDLQREESITAQLRAAHDYCARKRYSVVKEYIDEAFSARSDDRPDFQRMIEEAKTGQFDVLIVHKIDRFARDRFDDAYYKRVLKRANVSIEYVEQNIDGSPESIILESVLVGMAEYYSKNLAREVMKGLKENAHKAMFNGGIPPLGYRIEEGKYAINENEAEAVRTIFRMYLEGHGYISIAREINEKYVTRSGKKFQKNGLHEILKNEKYAGTYTYNKVKRRSDRTRNSHSKSEEMIVIENAIPPIVSREVFEMVREKMQKNKKRSGAYRATERYLLSGLVYCECGSAMVGRTSTTRGKKHHYYYCSARERGESDCNNPMIRRDKLEENVLDDMKNLFSTEKLPQLLTDVNEIISDASGKYEQEKKLLQKQKNEAIRKLENLYKLVEDGMMDEFTKERLNKHRLEIDRISSQIIEIENKESNQILSMEQVWEVIESAQEALQTKDMDKLQAVYNTFIIRVNVTKTEVSTKLKLPFCRYDGAEGGNQYKPTTDIIIERVENREMFKK